MKRLLRLSVLTGILVTFFSCAGLSPEPQPDADNPMKTVAVLPLKNDTMDVSGPGFVRGKLSEAVEEHHYNVQPLAETDQILRDRMGITLGGQLSMASAEQLKDALAVDGLIYGTLMDFGETTTGVYNVRKVRATFRLVDAGTGDTLWRNGVGVKCEDGTLDVLGSTVSMLAGVKDSQDDGVPWVSMPSDAEDEGVAMNLVKSLTTKLVAKATDVHLLAETDEMIRLILQTLPSGPGGGG